MLHVPPLRAASGRGSRAWTADATGQVKHVYTAPSGVIVAPGLTDAANVVRGQQRFEIPRGQYRPWDVSAAGF